MLIDLHHHLLPGIDDGPSKDEESLDMARIAVSEGFDVVVCTPHAYPGMYENDTQSILKALQTFQRKLDKANIPLKLMIGADAHIHPALLSKLQAGEVPTINESRYFLLEPPHVNYPAFLKEAVASYLSAGYIPIITHPERLDWAQEKYEVLRDLVFMGCWMQITSASITGYFGKRARRLSIRMLADGLVHVVATDAHSARHRKPEIKAAFATVSRLVGQAEAQAIFYERPLSVIKNVDLNPLQNAPAVRLGVFKRLIWKQLTYLKFLFLSLQSIKFKGN